VSFTTSAWSRRLKLTFAVNDLTFQEVTLYSHLADILTFFVRQHLFRTRNAIHSEQLAPRVAQLLKAPQKHVKLGMCSTHHVCWNQPLTEVVALKFFRTLISLQDTFYQALMTHNNTFGLILDIVLETMPRDNLLNSACLELFEFIKRENIKPFIVHVVEKYREKLERITYVDTFQNLIIRYDQMQGYGAEADSTLFSPDEGDTDTPRRMPPNGQRWQGVKEMDATEEEYFAGSDDEDDVSDLVSLVSFLPFCGCETDTVFSGNRKTVPLSPVASLMDLPLHCPSH